MTSATTLSPQPCIEARDRHRRWVVELGEQLRGKPVRVRSSYRGGSVVEGICCGVQPAERLARIFADEHLSIQRGPGVWVNVAVTNVVEFHEAPDAEHRMPTTRS